uniref:Uncharacterized protein n=1 Tax=Moniliophthora roreri TaxID=221103 RepID=A0A0W0F7T6_MONRR
MGALVHQALQERFFAGPSGMAFCFFGPESVNYYGSEEINYPCRELESRAIS